MKVNKHLSQRPRKASTCIWNMKHNGVWVRKPQFVINLSALWYTPSMLQRRSFPFSSLLWIFLTGVLRHDLSSNSCGYINQKFRRKHLNELKFKRSWNIFAACPCLLKNLERSFCSPWAKVYKQMLYTAVCTGRTYYFSFVERTLFIFSKRNDSHHNNLMD